MKTHYLYLDIVRCLACLLVVLMHSMLGGDNAVGYVYSIANTLAMPCNALFFMTSGALLLPVKSSGHEFLKKRLMRIIIPCLLWTVLYNISHVIMGDYSLEMAATNLLNIPFSSKGYGILWFIYVLIGLYILSPIISPWLNNTSRRSIEWVLSIWALTLVLQIVRNFICVPANEEHMFYYFGGYAGYFLLGYYIHHYDIRINSVLLIVLALLPFFVNYVLHFPLLEFIDSWSVLGYLSLFTALASASIFMLVKKYTPLCTNTMMADTVTRFADYTFGVYLVHIIVRNIISRFLWISQYGCIAELLMVWGLTTCFSFLLVGILSHLPLARFIVGGRNIRKNCDK